jgi:hypothetical protein
LSGRKNSEAYFQKLLVSFRILENSFDRSPLTGLNRNNKPMEVIMGKLGDMGGAPSGVLGMSVNEYSVEDMSDARSYLARLNSFYGQISLAGIKCSALLTRGSRDLSMADLFIYAHDGFFNKAIKKLGGAICKSQREDKLKELLDLKTQVEVLFLEHCGLLAKANALLEKCGLPGINQIDFMKEIPDFSVRNPNPNDDGDDEWLEDMDSMNIKTQNFIDKVLAATETVIERLESICVADAPTAPTSTTQEEAACSA